MSATNRHGLARQPGDFYETPKWAIDLVLPELLPSPGFSGMVLDPGAGNGAISHAVATTYPRADVCAVEKNPSLLEQAKAFRSPSVAWVRADFLREESFPSVSRFDLVIGNPPYRDAERFVRRALSLTSAKGEVAMLLRVGWVASKTRKDFWTSYPQADLLVLPRRPSFNGGGTDASDYAWFVWGPKRKGRWRRLGE